MPGNDRLNLLAEIRNIRRARLEWAESPENRAAFLLTGSEVVIGRRSDVDILLTHPLVSRQHARIIREDHREGPRFVVIDLQSSHGTWVNGIRIDRHALQARDKIRLGQEGVELLYLVGDQSTAIGSGASGLLEEAGIERSVRRLATVLPERATAEHSELEKISCLLDFHYNFGKAFSAEKTFQHVLKSALSISGAERGFVLRKVRGEFVFAGGLDSKGTALGQSEFRTSGAVVEHVARGGEPMFMTQGIEGGSGCERKHRRHESAGCHRLPSAPEAIVAGSRKAMCHGHLPGILYLDSQKQMHIPFGPR